jgi:nucleotide-binding universal stress UspA family protein
MVRILIQMNIQGKIYYLGDSDFFDISLIIKESSVEILFCTDGSNSSIQSAGLVSKFGFSANTHVVVLGVSESKAEIEKLTTSMDLIDRSLGISYSLDKKMRYGDPIEEIISEALERSYDLVIVGGGGNQLGLLDPQIGSTTGKLARKLHTHFLVVRNIPTKFTKVLFCAGADAPSSETMKLGGEWLSRSDARIGLLHVIPISQKLSVVGGEGELPSDLLIERSTEQLRDAGLKNEIVPQIRHGLVVEEVLKALTEGGYELLVVGSHYQPGQDRWLGTLLDDKTDQLLNRSTCSVLII